MQGSLFINAVNMTKQIMRKKVTEGNIVVDATVGNGNDTVFLADLVGETGKVYGFDIQELAIQNTIKKLSENNLLNRVELIKDSHEHMDKHVKENIDLAVFNLGYLPGGDHSIITRPHSTIKAIQKAIELLNLKGIILIVLYSGHKGGMEEKRQVEEYVKTLNQKKFSVLKFDFINQINNPPILIGIEKKKD